MDREAIKVYYQSVIMLYLLSVGFVVYLALCHMASTSHATQFSYSVYWQMSCKFSFLCYTVNSLLSKCASSSLHTCTR